MVSKKLITGLAALVLGVTSLAPFSDLAYKDKTPKTEVSYSQNLSQNIESYVKTKYNSKPRQKSENLVEADKKLVKYFPAWLEDFNFLQENKEEDEIIRLYVLSKLYEPILKKEVFQDLDDLIYLTAKEASKYDQKGYVNLETLKEQEQVFNRTYNHLSQSENLKKLGLNLKKLPTEYFFSELVQQRISELTAGSIGR